MHLNFSAHRCGFVLHSMGTEFVSSIQESLSTSPLTPVSHEYFMCSGLGLVDGRVLNSCFFLYNFQRDSWDEAEQESSPSQGQCCNSMVFYLLVSVV